MTTSVDLRRYDAGATLMRFDHIRAQRYTEIILFAEDAGTGQPVGRTARGCGAWTGPRP